MRGASLTTRLTLLFGSVSLVVLLGLGALITSTLEKHFVDQDRALLAGKVMLVHHLIERVDSRARLPAMVDELREAFIGHSDMEVLVRAPNGQILMGLDLPPLPLAILAVSQEIADAAPFEWEVGNRRLRGLAVLIKTRIADAPPMLVAVAIDMSAHVNFMMRFRDTLMAFLIGAALLSSLLGWLAVRRGLAPLRAMRERAAQVTASRLDERLPIDAVPVEFANLAVTLNEMLERLQHAFRRLSAFSSDIAHEFRTPISNLMTQTQVELSQARDSADYRDVLVSNCEEFERLGRMITDMLYLAKAEDGLQLPSRQRFALDREVDEVLDFYDAAAEERDIRLSRSGSGELLGDRSMLRRAISNLVSNALRYSSAGSEISVRIACTPSMLQISVVNEGQTIEPEHLPHLFDRFYRADKARSHKEADGTGLGLAITRAIVVAHGGEVNVTSSNGVTCFSMHFPQPDRA